MIVYRICQDRYKNDLSGNGAKKYGGRWNSPGNPLLYCASNAALALLEILAWTPIHRLIATPYSILHIKIDCPKNQMLSVTTEELEEGWESSADYTICRQIGDSWLLDKDHVVMKAPSALLPIETNVLLNPFFTKHFEVETITPLNIDQRLTNQLPDQRTQ